MPGGEGDAAWEDDARTGALFLEHPRLLLAAGVLLSVIALISVAGAGDDFPRFLPFFVIGLLLFFAAVYALTLSVFLAAAAAGGMALAVLWAVGFLGVLGIDLGSDVLTAIAVTATVGGMGIAQQVYGVVLALARGMTVIGASLRSARVWGWPPVFAMAVGLPGLAVLTPFERAPLVIVLLAGVSTLAAAIPIAFLFIPGVVSHFRPDENTFAHSNRLREGRENIAAYLAVLAAPRWAFAAFGIVWVAISLLLFGGARSQGGIDAGILGLWSFVGPAWPLAFLLSGAVCVAATGDWRALAVCMFPPFLMGMVMIWISAHAGLADPEALAKVFVAGGCAGAGIALLLQTAITLHRSFGDELAAGFGSAVNDSAVVVLIVGPFLFLAAALFAIGFRSALGAALMVPAVMIAVIAVLPVFATVMDWIFPPRRKAEELYGRINVK